MRILIAAIGKLKAGAERDLYDRYVKRSLAAGRAAGFGGLETLELAESKADTREARMADEASRLAARMPAGAHRIVLDERGKALSSAQLAAYLRALRADGGDIAFLVGGPDGHDQGIRQGARLVLSLSALTLPHGLARVVLAEQIYRSITIITGHPYHRE